MLFWVGKALQPLLWPFNQALCLLAAGLVCFAMRQEKWGRRLVVGSFVILFLGSQPWLAVPLYRSLERQYPPKRLAEYPTADAIVVLGGTAGTIQPPRVEPDELNGSRMVPAYVLWRLKKAPLILLSSGAPYRVGDRARVESEDMRDFLISLGVPEKALVIEPISRNTYENARECGQWLRDHGKKKILLVTSAFHMRRAAVFFADENLEVVPVATEHRMSDRGVSFPWDFFPDMGALGLLTGAIKEYVGAFVYHTIHPHRRHL